MSHYVPQAEGVAIHYGGVKALDGVDLTLEKGQIHGLIGPNGAGKSTVIDAITGRRRLTRGKVSLMGDDVSEFGAVERRRRGLAWRAAFSAPASLAACWCSARWSWPHTRWA
ncbi:ATP-binding cassette domain-containing protein [Diaphorobacter sp. HDW4B]|uniref:ATP-binding cassette domain-containing protein n=1 Tax=Diaphorobacter sp. HDW4B TaxID=2714925 RepID=UPI00210F526A|nr:ATP-binding cassette domain-containing protein [Diaphorobacter sp. HDW4B]